MVEVPASEPNRVLARTHQGRRSPRVDSAEPDQWPRSNCRVDRAGMQRWQGFLSCRKGGIHLSVISQEHAEYPGGTLRSRARMALRAQKSRHGTTPARAGRLVMSVKHR